MCCEAPKAFVCTLISSWKTSQIELLSHLPPALISSLFCHSHSVKQIFYSLAICPTLGQAMKRIPRVLVIVALDEGWTQAVLPLLVSGGKGMDLGAQRPGFSSRLHHRGAVSSWTSWPSSPSLGFSSRWDEDHRDSSV